MAEKIIPFEFFKISRRNFIFTGLSTLAALGLSLRSDRNSRANTRVDLTDPKPPRAIQEKEALLKELEELQLLKEIVEYRNAIGLEGLPEELQTALDQGDIEGPLERVVFDNALPEKNFSYGARAAEYMELIFGSYSTQMVKGAITNPNNPNGIGFTGGNSRYFVIPDNIHDVIPIVGSFDNYILHEACGHGSDPVSTRYTNAVLIRVVHGKWRALSQTFAVPEQFFNHPEDSMFPLIKRSVGALIARSLVDGKNGPTLDEPLTRYAHKITQIIAKNREITPADLKYNKALCEEIGYHFIANMLTFGNIKFTGELSDAYQELLEGACVEMYAEMFKHVILNPDQIHYNHEILTGIKEVIEGVRKESVSLGALRRALATPSNDVLERHEAETAIIAQQTPATLSPEEQANALKQQQETERREKVFSDFALSGIIPSSLQIHSVEKGQVVKFATLYSEVISKFPSLFDTSVQHLDVRFDPNLHIWEIQEIEVAMDSGFVRDLTASHEMNNPRPYGRGFFRIQASLALNLYSPGSRYTY